MKHVEMYYLRQYRDECLQPSASGRLVIRFYAFVSRVTYPLFDKSRLMRSLLKRLFINPAASFARNRLNKKIYQNYRDAEAYKRMYKRLKLDFNNPVKPPE